MLTFYFSLMDTEGQRSRFEQIYRENCQLMLALALRILREPYLAEDAVQDAFVRVASHMETVERLEDWQARRYVLTAARNAAIDLYRKRSRQALSEILYEDPEAGAELVQAEDSRENTVLEAVKNLPVHYRDVFLLKYSLGLTNGEIGELLGLTVSGVKQRVARGKELLRAELTEAGFGIP